jgi:hypothetical protein
MPLAGCFHGTRIGFRPQAARASQTGKWIGIVRVTFDGFLQCCDGVRYAVGLKASEAKIVVDDRTVRLQQCRTA